MGRSRSATIVIAYLLWHSHHRRHQSDLDSSGCNVTSYPSCDISPSDHAPLTPESALILLRRGRAVAEPNESFKKQLHLYHSLGCPSSINDQPKYQRWLYHKTVEANLAMHRPPKVAEVRFEDEHEVARDVRSSLSSVPPRHEIDLRCRKCRSLLAKSDFLIDHKPLPTDQGQRIQTWEEDNCAHVFVQPLSWMRACLSDGDLDGRLTCPSPKCRANVGKFAWQGMRCSCGEWVTPGFGLARGRVDKARTTAWNAGTANRESMPGIRLPPGMRKETLPPAAQVETDEGKA